MSACFPSNATLAPTSKRRTRLYAVDSTLHSFDRFRPNVELTAAPPPRVNGALDAPIFRRAPISPVRERAILKDTGRRRRQARRKRGDLAG